MALPRPTRLAALALAATAAMVVLRLWTAVGGTAGTAQGPEDGDPPQVSPAVEVSGAMPEVSGEALGGGTVYPGLYRGKVVVVNFWASWCAPCRREQPVLQRLWDDYRDRGVQFLGVNHRDDRGEAVGYVEEFGVTYPSVVDPDESLASAFGVPYIPTTILVDPRGELRWRLPGEQDRSTLERLIDRLLAE